MVATFHQQGQTVHNQVNSDQAVVNMSGRSAPEDIDELIGELIARLRHDPEAAARAGSAEPELVAARAAARAGDRRGFSAHLRRAAELAPSLATAITGIASLAHTITSLA